MSIISAKSTRAGGASSVLRALPAECEPAVKLPRRGGLYRNFFKRALDILAILAAVPIILPMVLMLAIMVARDGGRPFYTQMRVGRGGRPFRMWKLRSMVIDADQRLEAWLAANPEARAEWDSTQKLRHDPRITPFGHFLRRSSLDELPQLWNVFIGDMSLVGPRPMMLSQREIYPGTAYYALRPGVTGYWQTAGRNRTTFEARAEFDAIYEEQLSLKSDLTILARTVGVVLRGTGC
ncbi:sugar transferase [Xinfangfangia sp. D13-10-4-6]|uniref:sugar transferase n=1 Tax=Pseudogemmobacter hezensis TaxID=2737662 RepID=UPI0015544E9F|nr:sugar transferase [Pseudogemmobacter hezensis]NPD13873.1 sugar transferase [Pseudogemmobacter hezensis]